MDPSGWSAAYAAARAAREEIAESAFLVVTRIESRMMAAPASPKAAHACLHAAVTIMADEAGSEAAEPSYANLMRAALRQLTPSADPGPPAG